MSEKIEWPATDHQRPFEVENFPAKPDLDCDIVMKGGITSVVICPLAVCQLATTYRLRSVGAPPLERSPRRRRPQPPSWDERRGRRPRSPEPRCHPASSGWPRFPICSPRSRRRQVDAVPPLPPQPETQRLFELLTAGMHETSRLPKPVTAKPVITMVTPGCWPRRPPRPDARS